MSKICLCVLQGVGAQENEITELINPLLHKHSVFLFSDVIYQEPFLDTIDRRKSIVFSISEDNVYDNCDFLFLPDNCSINGFKNPSSFYDRMKRVQYILTGLSKFCSIMELFVGDSGCGYDEYEECKINICNFADFATCLNSLNSPDIHFIFDLRKTEGKTD